MYVVCSTLRESFTSISQNELSLALATHYSFPIKTKWLTLISLGVGINEETPKFSCFLTKKSQKPLLTFFDTWMEMTKFEVVFHFECVNDIRQGCTA